jgi:hypothetical protein
LELDFANYVILSDPSAWQSNRQTDSSRDENEHAPLHEATAGHAPSA